MKKSLFLLLAILAANVQYAMSQEKITQTAGHVQLGEFAPKFAELNDDVLFGEVWNRPGLSPHDRSMVTVAALIGKGIIDSSLAHHLEFAKQNGVTRTEISEMLTHIAFYAGWPNAWGAFRLAKDVWAEDGVSDDNGKSVFQQEMIFPIVSCPHFRRSDPVFECHIRASLPQQLAYPSRHEGRWTDACVCGRARMVSGRRQACSADASGRCHPYPGKCKALAWRGC